MAQKPLTIVFCIPGESFGGKFLESYTNILAFCFDNNIRFVLSRAQSCNIYYVRNMCLGADLIRGKNQKPFDGKLDYDYLMWIDSDIIFTPAQFSKLLNCNKDIVSGIYQMADGKSLATVQNWDEEYFKHHGHFNFLTLQDINGKEDLIEVSYTGMGFMLMKKGVFENMEYPWFRPIEKQIGDAIDFTMEDVAFCLKAAEAGFKVFVDPAVRVGHEKKIVL
jgi:hypothetical protein